MFIKEIFRIKYFWCLQRIFHIFYTCKCVAKVQQKKLKKNLYYGIIWLSYNYRIKKGIIMNNDFERPKTLDESRGELLKEILMKEFLLKQKHKAEIEDLWKPYKDIENA